MGGEDFTIKLSVARYDNETKETDEAKPFSLSLGAEAPLRLGRGPVCDIIVTSRHASSYHCELRVVQLEGHSEPQLCVRDLSMNGTGLTRPSGETCHLEKEKDTPLETGSILHVPMTMKASADQSQRSHFKVEILGQDGNAEGKKKHKKKKRKHKRAAEEEEEDEQEQAGNEDDAEDTEGKRMVFVELLLKTKEVNAGMSYEEATELLSGNPEWNVVNEATRKECFDIFVEHLASNGGSGKSKKSKAKDKHKGKASKHKKDEEDAEKVERRRRRKDSQSSGGEKKQRKKHRRAKAASDVSEAPAPKKRRKRQTSASE